MIRKKLILSVLEEFVPQNEKLLLYKFLTNDNVNRFKKLYTLVKYKIPMRFKEKIVLILKN
jgi:hypothetical protein